MARCRGSSRQAPSPRLSRHQPTVSTQNGCDNITPAGASQRLEQPRPTTVISGSIHSDHHQMKELHITLALRTKDKAAYEDHEYTGSTEITDTHPKLLVPLAGMGAPVEKGPEQPRIETMPTEQQQRRQVAHPGYEQQHLTNEPSYADLAPAAFEQNEKRRMKLYEWQVKLENEAYGRALRIRNRRSKKLTRHRELSRPIPTSKHKIGKSVAHNVREEDAQIKGTQNGLSLKGPGKPVALPLSPVFRIAPPAFDDYETSALDFEELWPRDFPMPPITSPPPLGHVPHPPLAPNRRLDRDFTQEYLLGDRATANQPLIQRRSALERLGKSKREELDKSMPVVDISAYIDFGSDSEQSALGSGP